jgi:Uma2 family endonuclease
MKAMKNPSSPNPFSQAWEKGSRSKQLLTYFHLEDTMTVATNRKLTLEQYLNYEDGTGQRYEILDGVLVEMGTESALNLSIAFVLGMALANLGIPGYLIGSKHRIAVSSTQVSVREPDLLVHSEASYATVSQKKESLLEYYDPLPALLVEVVSPGDEDSRNYARDYLEKPVEYADRGIPEFWIIDPVRAWVWVLILQGNSYQKTEFRGGDAIVSMAFPELKLTAEKVLKAGR